MTSSRATPEPIRNRAGDVVYASFQDRPKPDFTLGSFHKALLLVSIAITIVLPIYFAIRAMGTNNPLAMQQSLSGEVTREGSVGEAMFSLVALGLAALFMAVMSRFPRIFNYPVMLTEDNVQRQYKNAVQLMIWLTAGMALIAVVMVGGWLVPFSGSWTLLPAGVMFAVTGFFLWRMFQLR